MIQHVDERKQRLIKILGWRLISFIFFNVKLILFLPVVQVAPLSCDGLFEDFQRIEASISHDKRSLTR